MRMRMHINRSARGVVHAVWRLRLWSVPCAARAYRWQRGRAGLQPQCMLDPLQGGLGVHHHAHARACAGQLRPARRAFENAGGGCSSHQAPARTPAGTCTRMQVCRCVTCGRRHACAGLVHARACLRACLGRLALNGAQSLVGGTVRGVHRPMQPCRDGKHSTAGTPAHSYKSRSPTRPNGTSFLPAVKLSGFFGGRRMAA